MSRLIIILISLSLLQTTQAATVVVIPRGSALDRGRKLEEGFERGLSHTIARQLAKETHALLSHHPDAARTHEQIVSAINMLPVACAIVIGCYQSPTTTISVIRYTDFVHTMPLQGTALLCATTETFALQLPTTEKLAAACVTALRAEKLTVSEVLTAPVKHLEGLLCPSFMIDIGVPHEQAVTPIVTALTQYMSEVTAS